MGFLPLFFLLYHLAGMPEVTSSKIPSTQQCADQKCIVPLSQGKTVLRYIADDPRVLSFTAGEDVVIYSKAQDYYGAKIRGRFGFVPRTFVRETKILEKELPFTVSTDNEENSSLETSKTVPVSASPVMEDDHTPLNTLQQIEKLTQAYLQQKSEVVNSAAAGEQVDGLYSENDELEPSVPVTVEPYFTTTAEMNEVSSTTAIPSLVHTDILSEPDILNGDHNRVPSTEVPKHEGDSVLSPHEKLGVDPYVNSNIVENIYHPDKNELLGAASKEVPVILEDFSSNLNVNFPETGFNEPEVKNILDSEVQAKLEEIVNASAESVFNSTFLDEERNSTEQLDRNLDEKTFGINDIKPLLTTFDSSPNEGSSEAELDHSGEEDQEEEDAEDEAEDDEEGQEEEVADSPPELESQQLQPASHSAPADVTPASVESESLVPHNEIPEKQPEIELSAAEQGDEVVHKEVPEEMVQSDEKNSTEVKHAEEAETPEERVAVEVAHGETDNQGNIGKANGFLSKLTSFFSSEVPPEQSIESTEEPVRDEKVGLKEAASEQANPMEVLSSVENQEVSVGFDKGLEETMKDSENPTQLQEDQVKLTDVNDNLVGSSHAEPTVDQEVFSPETDVQEREKEMVVQEVPDQKAEEHLQHVHSEITEDHSHQHDDHNLYQQHDHGHGHSHNHGHSHHQQHNHRHSHNHYGHGHSHNHRGHGRSHNHDHGHGHSHSHNYDHGHTHSPTKDNVYGDLNNEITNEHSDINNSDHSESHQDTHEDHALLTEHVEHSEPVVPSADIVSDQITQNVVDHEGLILADQVTEDSILVQSVTETPPGVPDISTESAEQPNVGSESADGIIAPDGYCDADGQICGTATTLKPTSRFLLEDEPSIEEYTPEEPGMLSEVLLPPRSELIAILTSVGIVVAVFLVLSQVVKTCAGRAKLVERVNRVESQLVVSLEQISCLQSERSKFKGKENELRSKLLVAEESCKELGEKTQFLEVEKAREAAAKKELEKKFEDVVQVSNEQGTMQTELLAMQEELLQQKAELEALLQSKEEECDHYRREATEVRELLSSIELQLSSATDKATQLESAERKCAELLNEKCELQINIQNLKEENSLIQSSLIEKASEAQSLRVVLEKVESRGGSLPSGSLDDLMDAAKIKAELDSTREEYETLRNQLVTLNKEHTESKRIAEELRTTVQQLEYQLTTATEERNKAEDSLKILTDFFEKQKKELAEKLKLYEDTKGNSASLMQRFEKELELAKSEVGSLQAQVEMYKKALEDQERSLKAEIKAETQRSVEAQLITKNWQRRCEAALREAADLRRRVTELTALNESASRNASMTGSENDLPHLNGGLDVLPPPPFPFPHSMPFPPFPEGMPPLPLDPALMERPTTLGMRSPPFGQPYYEDRGTPNSFRAYSPRSRSPSGSERSEDFRRYRDSYRPESVGRSRDPSPLREYDRRRRDRTPPRHRV